MRLKWRIWFVSFFFGFSFRSVYWFSFLFLATMSWLFAGGWWCFILFCFVVRQWVFCFLDIFSYMLVLHLLFAELNFAGRRKKTIFQYKLTVCFLFIRLLSVGPTTRSFYEFFSLLENENENDSPSCQHRWFHSVQCTSVFIASAISNRFAN